MSKQLRFGFVGAGEVAVASAKAVSEASNIVLERVVDMRAELAADLVTTYGGRVAGSIEAACRSRRANSRSSLPSTYVFSPLAR